MSRWLTTSPKGDSQLSAVLAILSLGGVLYVSVVGPLHIIHYVIVVFAVIALALSLTAIQSIAQEGDANV
jgi:hypothetical protein